MKRIYLGLNANRKPMFLTEEMRRGTHCHCVGGSGTGKSKFLECMIRQDLRQGQGFCLIDWHGTLYNDLLHYCTQLDIGLLDDFRSLVLLNPSRPDFITGFNPFIQKSEDTSTQVSKWIDATVKTWGVGNTDTTPTLARVARILYTFMAETRQTLANAVLLLQFPRRDLREYALRHISDSWVRGQLESLQAIKTEREWREQTLSLDNRMARFVGSKGVRRFMGLTDNNIDLVAAMDEGKIILVNLGDSGYLDREAAKVFAALFLNEFFRAAMFRANRSQGREEPKQYVLYLDEFQEYITEDMAAMLDQVRKGGLHMVLAHQHLGHFADNPRLRKSVLTNARIRAVFGGLDYLDASDLGNEMFLPDLNTRQIKKAYYHTIHLYREETRTIYSRMSGQGTGHSSTSGRGSGSASGSGTVIARGSGFSQFGPPDMPWLTSEPVEGWHTNHEGSGESTSKTSIETSSSGESDIDSQYESESETEVPVFVPIPVKELVNETEWNREDKLSKIVELLKCQQKRHCFIKLDTAMTQPIRVPFVGDCPFSPEYLCFYQEEVYRHQKALPAEEVDRLIAENEKKFLNEADADLQADAEEDHGFME
jgi:hypothetical protein